MEGVGVAHRLVFRARARNDVYLHVNLRSVAREIRLVFNCALGGKSEAKGTTELRPPGLLQ